MRMAVVYDRSVKSLAWQQSAAVVQGFGSVGCLVFRV